jgi:hypothetical protein
LTTVDDKGLGGMGANFSLDAIIFTRIQTATMTGV